VSIVVSKKAIVAGGSLGGLMTGIILKAVGIEVHLMKTTKIEIYSDIICPWCYIGKRRMEAGLKLLDQEFNHTIVWRPFQLNPDMPLEGITRKIYRSRKFGSWERSVAMDTELAATGKSLGIDFNYDKVLMTPNTFAAHRLLWWAEQRNVQDPLVEALFSAYFVEGRDVGRLKLASQRRKRRLFWIARQAKERSKRKN
jgi:predicted DsbA family dithiol-disulfide isomerase